MPIPTHLTAITVTGKWIEENGTACSGTCGFLLSATGQVPLDNTIVPQVEVVATLDATGAISLVLPATDDPDWSQVGLTYKVTERITGAPVRTYYIQVPAASPGGTVDLADVAPVAVPPVASQFVLVSSVGQIGGPAGPLDGTGKIPSSQVPASGASVNSVNGKTGIVVLNSTDVGADASGAATSAVTAHDGAVDPHGDRAYTDTQIATRVPTTRTLTAGTGLTGGGDLSANRTFSVVDNTTIQKVRASLGGTLVGTRREVNFIQGANVTLTVADDNVNDRVNVTVAASGGGSGSGAEYLYGAAQYNLVTVPADPIVFTVSSATANGGTFAALMRLPAGIGVTGCGVYVDTAGTVGAGGENRMGVYDAAGNQLGVTLTNNNQWINGQAWATADLVAPIASSASDRYLYLLFVVNGYTAPPRCLFPTGAGGTAPPINLGKGTVPRRAIFNGGAATLPASFTPGTFGSATNFLPLCGLY